MCILAKICWVDFLKSWPQKSIWRKRIKQTTKIQLLVASKITNSSSYYFGSNISFIEWINRWKQILAALVQKISGVQYCKIGLTLYPVVMKKAIALLFCLDLAGKLSLSIISRQKSETISNYLLMLLNSQVCHGPRCVL